MHCNSEDCEFAIKVYVKNRHSLIATQLTFQNRFKGAKIMRLHSIKVWVWCTISSAAIVGSLFFFWEKNKRGHSDSDYRLVCEHGGIFHDLMNQTQGTFRLNMTEQWSIQHEWLFWWNTFQDTSSHWGVTRSDQHASTPWKLC